MKSRNQKSTDKKCPITSELPGLPLTLLHTVAFYKAIMSSDVFSSFLFSWWGPGFLIVAAIYLYDKQYNSGVDWKHISTASSYACKLNYLVLMIIFYNLGLPSIMFAYSAWIIGDQIRLAWFSNNADRTRRTFEDHWLIRTMYPAFLLIPLLFNMPYRTVFTIFGISIFIVWLLAIDKVRNNGNFFQKPDGYDNLRDIVYLGRD